MLFVVTHTHSPDLCPVDNPAPVHQLASESHITDAGVKALGSYIAAPEHTLYFILEADEYAQLVRYFRPMMKIGTVRITPVQTLAESLGLFPAR